MYVRSPDVLWRRTPTAVLLRTLDGRTSTLRGTGVALWDELERPGTVEEVVGRLLHRFEDPSGTLEADVTDALEALVADGIVVERP